MKGSVTVGQHTLRLCGVRRAIGPHKLFLPARGFPSGGDDRASAAASGLTALGLADLDGVYGLAKAHWKAKDLPGFKLLCGAELTLEGAPPLVLHARTKAGWSLLCRLITASHADKPKGEAGLQWGRFVEMVQAAPAKGGLLCLPLDAAIFGAEALTAPELDLLPVDPYPMDLCDLFGDDLYLPLLRQRDGQDAARTARARQLGQPELWLSSHRQQPTPLPRARAPPSAGRPGLHPGRREPGRGGPPALSQRRALPERRPREMGALFGDWPETLSASLDAAQPLQLSPGRAALPLSQRMDPAGAERPGLPRASSAAMACGRSILKGRRQSSAPGWRTSWR